MEVHCLRHVAGKGMARLCVCTHVRASVCAVHVPVHGGALVYHTKARDMRAFMFVQIMLGVCYAKRFALWTNPSLVGHIARNISGQALRRTMACFACKVWRNGRVTLSTIEASPLSAVVQHVIACRVGSPLSKNVGFESTMFLPCLVT